MSQTETNRPANDLAQSTAVQDLAKQDIDGLHPRALLISLAQEQIKALQSRIDHQNQNIEVCNREALAVQRACRHQQTTLLQSKLPQLLTTAQENCYLGESVGLCLDCGAAVICCPSCGKHQERYQDPIVFAGRFENTISIGERIERLDESGVTGVLRFDTEPGQCFMSRCSDCHIEWYWIDQVERDWSH